MYAHTKTAMHFHWEIYLPPGIDVRDLTNVRALIQEYLAPYRETDDGEGLWDWYCIGGRWTGAHDGYEPRDDRQNFGPCRACNGKGHELGIWCSRCYGHGTQSHPASGRGDVPRPEGPTGQLAWSTEWVAHEEDVMSIRKLAETKPDLDAYFLLVPPHAPFQLAKGNGSTLTNGTAPFDGQVLAKLRELDATDGYLVTVDCHC